MSYDDDFEESNDATDPALAYDIDDEFNEGEEGEEGEEDDEFADVRVPRHVDPKFAPTELPTDPDVVEDLALLNVDLLRQLVSDSLARRGEQGVDVARLNPLELREVALHLARSQSGNRQSLMGRLARPWRMSHTELSLRLAVYLLRERIVTSTVHVAVARAELVRRRHPWFDIPGFLARYQAVPGAVDRYDRVYSQYLLPGVDHDLQIERDRGQGSIVADVGPGSRLIVHACPGPIQNSKSSREHMVLRHGVGTALTHYEVSDEDFLVVAVPRSPRMQRLVRKARERRGIVVSRLSLVLVDRADRVDGLPFPGRYEPPTLELA